MIFWISVTAIGSMPANGSSSSMKRGDTTSARVISARRRSPPDSVWAGAFASGVRFSSPSSSSSRFRRSRRVEVQRLENRHDVLLDRKPAEDRRLLRQVADALSRANVHRIVGHVLAVENHPPGVRRRQSHGHVERRRLAGAVGAEQTDDLARSDLEADAADDGAAAVRLGELVRAQRRHQRAGGAGHGPAALRLRADLLVAVDDDAFGRLEEGHRACRSFRGTPRRS